MAKRLIDANAYACPGDLVNEPTVDAVEVCYCKDCAWRDVEDDCVNPKCGKSWYGCPVPDEHYCSYGERKGGQAPQREDV